MKLTEQQIQYGFYHQITKPDKCEWRIEVPELPVGPELTINCTQLDGGLYRSTKEKKRVVTEWCEFLTQNPKAFKALRFGTRMPQQLFDAVCHQQNLERLEIKWGAYTDLSAIENLQKLKLLEIGSGAGVESVAPISKLPNLLGLYVSNFQKINDYSELVALKKLQTLAICGDFWSPQYIKVKSLDFLRAMPQLRHLCLETMRLASKDYSPILSLRRLESLQLAPRREVKAIFEELYRLPKLKWGELKENSERYK